MRALARHWASSGACDRPYDNHLLWPTSMGVMMGLMMVIMMAYEGSPSGLLTLLSLKVDAAFSILEARGTQGGPGGPRGKPGKEYPGVPGGLLAFPWVPLAFPGCPWPPEKMGLLLLKGVYGLLHRGLVRPQFLFCFRLKRLKRMGRSFWAQE